MINTLNRQIIMIILNRQITVEDLRPKGFPFQCLNCGNRPTPEQVVQQQGACEICGDIITAYSIDTAEHLIAHCKDDKRLLSAAAKLLEACQMMDKCHGKTDWAMKHLSTRESEAILAIRAAIAEFVGQSDQERA